MTESSIKAHQPSSFFTNFGFRQDILTFLSTQQQQQQQQSPQCHQPPTPKDQHMSLTSMYSTSDDEAVSESETAYQHHFKSERLDTAISQLTQPKSSTEHKAIIKAYKSKLKTKFKDIYENNSKTYEDKTKYKIYHKCCYPHCGRTFSSAGWLKAHFEEHLKEISQSQFSKLFDKYFNDIC